MKMMPYLEGFSASSLFEAKLAREVLGTSGTVHMVTPCYRPDEIDIISEISDYISFNSIPQWERFSAQASVRSNCGLRINPQLPFVDDKRYNPCRKHSKLGVPLSTLAKISSNGSGILKGLKGIHFHSNSESTDFSQLLATVRHIDAHIPHILQRIEWVNMGGGYLFDEAQNTDKFKEAVDLLKTKYRVEVFIEPGKGIVGKAGRIITEVVDIFESDGHNIAILDTSVNHMPEVFEYQYKPEVREASPQGKHSYILGGATCLAGDIFGKYRFKEPLEIGSRLTFENMGAYTLVKAHMFNGVNLPSIYVQRLDGTLELVKKYTYEDFISRCGADSNVSI